MARLTYPEGNSYAKLAVKSGADAIAVSNHAGGNSMDRVVWGLPLGLPSGSEQLRAASMPPIGTFETCRLYRSMSAARGNSEDICSGLSSSQFNTKQTLRSCRPNKFRVPVIANSD
jgi:hypothetical protein